PRRPVANNLVAVAPRLSWRRTARRTSSAPVTRFQLVHVDLGPEAGAPLATTIHHDDLSTRDDARPGDDARVNRLAHADPDHVRRTCLTARRDARTEHGPRSEEHTSE